MYKSVLKTLQLLLFSMIFFNISFSQEIDCIDTTLIDSLNMQLPCIEFSGYIPSLFSPVCGCDSVTYSSSLCAYYHGVQKTTNEPCSCIEPTFKDTSKNIIDFIRFLPYGETDPVLGCDGNYYPSVEMAILYGGVTSFTRDSIPCIVQSYIDTTLDLSMYPDRPVCGCDKKTYRNKYEAFFYGGNISWKNHKCTCIEDKSIDTTIICPDVYDPVCGCDRVTYKNECIAVNHFGVQYTQPGECPCVDSTLILNDSIIRAELNDVFYGRFKPVCGCDSITYHNSIVAQFLFGIAHWSEGPCKCIDTSKINKEFPCPEQYFPVLGCNGKLYKNPCIALYHHGIMEFYTAPCQTDLQIDTTIECNPHFNYDPVCGCDTVTYPNECYAKYHAGITKWYYGSCITDTTCIDTFLIDTLQTCLDTYDPVCGCDSITYTNECIAKYRYGVKKWRQGKCTTSTININEDKNSIVFAYPNPFKDKINLLFTIDNLPQNIQIYDMLGNKILNKNIKDKSINQSIFLKNIKTGIYLINIKLQKGSISKKMIKM